jgi:hypothetical protein
MADEQVVGMHYFDHQFLRTGDFDAAQTYHIDRLRQHNRLLHRAGIIDGLDVTRIGPRSVQVTPGRAVDQAHREVVLRQTADPEVRTLLRVQTVDGTLETEVHMPGTGLRIDLDRVPASTTAGNSVFLTIRQEIKETTPIVDPGITGNTRFVERAVIEASTAPLSGAQLLLAQINRNPDGTIAGNLVFTNRQQATAFLAANSVTSVTIAEADGTTAQDTNTGRGIKTGHIQQRAVTSEKIAENAIQAINLEPGFLQSLGGGPRWVRLPFLPKQLGTNPSFNLGPTHSDSTGEAHGVMEIPVPAGATRVTRLRITGTENTAGITIQLRLAKINSSGSRDILLTHTFSGANFNVLLTVPNENSSLNAELEGLALQVKANARSDIWFIAAEFT